MAKNCAIIPRVTNKQGEQQDSRLFIDLLSFTSNREKATELYQITKNNDFIEAAKDKVTLDNLGEPTLKSLMEHTSLSKYIPEQQVLQNLNKQIGRFTKRDTIRLYIDNKENQQELFQRVLNFNKTNPFKGEYVATIKKVMDSESNRVFLSPKIEKKNQLNSLEADKMEYNQNLNNRLRDILASKGVTVGALDELERRRGIAGVTDFDLAKDAATGLIELIRLANGIEGEKALPEEFAHFALAAMDNNPLLNRLLSTIGQHDLTREILGKDYDTYSTLYGGNNDTLIKEAAGKLLAQALINNTTVQQPSIKLLFNRFIQAVKQFFQRFNGDDVLKAIIDADSLSSQLAKNILSGQLDSSIKLSNVHTSEKFYNVDERVQRDKELLNKMRETELKRLEIYSKRNPKSLFTDHLKALIEKIESDLVENEYVNGVYNFLNNTLSELTKVSSRLTTLINTPGTSINEKASVLRDVRNYMFSYSSLLKEVKEALREEELASDNRYGAKMRESVRDVSELLENLEIDYNKVTKPLFLEFIKPFFGENLVVPFGKDKGKVIRAEDLIEIADKDISFLDRWMDSMADSSDMMNKVFSQSVKNVKDANRLRVIELVKLIEAAAMKLELAGVKDLQWMFEKDSKGNITGDYISEINTGLYNEKYRDLIAELEQKYGKNPVGVDAQKYKLERLAWLNANREVLAGRSQPKRSLYTNQTYTTLNPAQREYYDTIMDIKDTLDALIPDKYTHLTNAILIRKDLVERVKGAKGFREGSQEIWESIKDSLLKREDDTEFGENKEHALKDFEGRLVQNLPIYYTRKLKDLNSLSTDVTSTMIAYAAMAIDYDGMSQVLDTLEIGRELMRERLVTQTQGGKVLVEKFKVMGRQVENKLYKSGEASRLIERLNDFFEMQVYGRYMADEGTIGGTKIEKAKAANVANFTTAIGSLALSALSGISNVMTGSVMTRTEAISGEFFNMKHLILADKTYSVEMPFFLSQLGSRILTGKLALFNEKFNILQEFDKEISHKEFDRKSLFSKLMSVKSLFFMSNAGEHWMQTRIGLALASNYKMKDSSGKVVSLWDALEVVNTDSSNKSLGASLRVKEGYTKEDGSVFTNEDITKFSLRSGRINLKIQGIYNKEDRAAMQRLALGRMAIMFRKYLVKNLEYRFGGVNYDMALESWEEGYYRTAGKFLVTLAKDLKSALFNISAHWKDLTKPEKANMIRAIVEVAQFAIISALLAIIKWPTDKNRPWAIKMAEYLLKRLYTEIGAMVPGRQLPGQMLKMLNSPMAGINTIQSTLNLLDVFNPVAWSTELDSGRYKGHSPAYKSFFESPLAPMYKTVQKGLHPDESLAVFGK